MAGLFTSLGLAGSALNASGAALRTVGQNIANANTEGYTRQQVELAARAPDRYGNLQIGTGVEVSRIGRIIDDRLESMIRDARSSLGDLQTRDRTLGQIEDLMGNLDQDPIAASLSQYFAAAEDLVNHPEDPAARALLAARGEDLAAAFRTRDGQLADLRRSLEQEVGTSVEQVNRLTREIADLNRQIASSEAGGIDLGAANDLRDQRGELLKKLSDLVSIKTVETASGNVNVVAGSEFLVLGDRAKELVLDTQLDGDVPVSTVRFASDGQRLAVRGGQLKGLLDLRDQTVPALRQEIDQLAGAVISEVNRVQTQGEGLVRSRSLTGTVPLADPNASLTAGGLLPPARNGSFDLRVVDENTGLAETFNISVALGGPSGSDTSLADLADQINAAVSGRHPSLSASVTFDGRLKIESTDPSLSFSFANDTSGAMAGLGMGTFFTGRGAADMALNPLVSDDPRLIATGQGGGPTDARNAQSLAALRDAKVLQQGGATFEEYYRGLVGVLGVDRSRAKDLLANQQTVTEHLVNERSAISGVNVDEESIDLMKYQRAYQGAARFLSVVDSLLEALLNA